MKLNNLPFLFFLVLIYNVTAQAHVINAGIGGNNTLNLLERVYTDVIQQRPDFAILMVGTNDMLNSKKMVSYAKYEENLDKIVKKISTEGIKAILMTSPPVDPIYLYQRHDKKLYRDCPNIKLNLARQIVIKISRKYGMDCIDLFQIFTNMGLPEHNKDLFFRNERNSGAKDGIHPTNLGYHFIAETVFDHLKFNNLLKKDQKIVCFGDSITNGAGTIRSKNYPSVLSRLIIKYFEN